MIPILHEVQERYGWISPKAAVVIGEYLRLSDNHVYAVATFYHDFRVEPPARRVITICDGPACRFHGSQELLAEVERNLGIRPGEMTSDSEYGLGVSPCLGICPHPLAALVNHEAVGRLQPGQAERLIGEDADNLVSAWDGR